MGNMVRATVTIEGDKPLLWHHFGPEALPLEKQERTGKWYNRGSRGGAR